jgi:TPR repeat protein
MYDSGLGIAQDSKEAAKWFRAAAEQGDVTAQLNLGLAYAKGQGVNRDFNESIKWFRLSAAQGNPVAQDSMGVSYRGGLGVPMDYVHAFMWFTLAAAQGNAAAVANQEMLQSMMLPAQIAQAQDMARRCGEAKYQNCD